MADLECQSLTDSVLMISQTEYHTSTDALSDGCVD